MTETAEKITPFSTGTGHAEWQDSNCDCCKKCYQPPVKNGDITWPKDKTMRQYVRDGRECEMKYSLDMAWIDGTMPLEMALKVGYDPDGNYPRWPQRCKEWVDRGNGGNPRGPRRPKPIPDNQMVLGFEFSAIAQNHTPIKETVTP
jgi:hypothetical protein